MSDRLIYKVQRYGSWEWLDLDLQITTDGPWESLSTYEILEGKVPWDPERTLAEDGRRVLEPWGSLIHVETADRRVWTGIVEPAGNGHEGNVRAREWHGYLDGLVFLGRIWGVQADPADLARELVAHVQSYPTGRLGITVSGSTPSRVGTDSDDKMLAAKAVAAEAKRALDARTKPRKAKEAEIKRRSAPHDRTIKAHDTGRAQAVKALELLQKRKNPKPTDAELKDAKDLVAFRRERVANARKAKKAEIDPLRTQLESLKKTEATAKAAHDKAREVFQDAKQKVSDDGGAWKALAEDTPDCWDILRDLAAVAPFEFTTRTERTDGAPKLTLQVHHPRAGAARTDLVFEQGRNIAEMPEVRIPAEYASEVIGLGAGEGVGYDGGEVALRVSVAIADPRMRRTAVFSDPSITTNARLRTASRAELRTLRGVLEVPEIVVRDDENCPIGAWSAGDDIYLKLNDVPFFGQVRAWFRVKAWQRIGTSKAKLRLERVVDG